MHHVKMTRETEKELLSIDETPLQILRRAFGNTTAQPASNHDAQQKIGTTSGVNEYLPHEAYRFLQTPR